jgi:hypothetical protein
MTRLKQDHAPGIGYRPPRSLLETTGQKPETRSAGHTPSVICTEQPIQGLTNASSKKEVNCLDRLPALDTTQMRTHQPSFDMLITSKLAIL